MRLGQLARKLSLRPSQLVDFLATNNIETQEGSNTRLADEHARMIILQFSPESLEEIMKPAAEAEASTEASQPEQRETLTQQQEPGIEPDTETKPEETTIPDEEIPAGQMENEVIRVQRIELSGLKVLGKIELPEPKKKEPKVTEGDDSATELKPERRGKVKHQKRERDSQNWRNPLDLQRQREARLQEEQRKAELEREKEKRKLHYQAKVKQVKVAKRAKSAKETVNVKKPVDTRPVPKTWLGKFFRWWTT
jgi:hypothetical protein